jgi:type II secretory pathway pseudopilin PulG
MILAFALIVVLAIASFTANVALRRQLENAEKRIEWLEAQNLARWSAQEQLQRQAGFAQQHPFGQQLNQNAKNPFNGH